MSARNSVGASASQRLVVAAGACPAGWVTAGARAMGRLLSGRTAAQRAPRGGSKRSSCAKSQQLRRRSMTHWRAIGMRADCKRLMGEVHMRDGREVPQPPYGKIKAARCGPVGWLRSVGISAPWREVRLSPHPAFSEKARRVNGRRTSRPDASGLPAIREGRSVALRGFQPFGSSFGSWHTVTMACPHKTRRLAGPPISAAVDLAGDPGRER
jgi:hypothetical protein